MKEIRKNRTICIGITGSFASGKTTAAKIIEAMGYNVIYTDMLAKELMVNNQSIRKKLIDEFGENVYNPDGTLHSVYLSEIVFSGANKSNQKLKRLNQIVHPAVIDEMIDAVDDFEERGEKLVFVESALIYEAGLEEGFDYIINVYTEKDEILKRAVKRGFSVEQAKIRLSEQLSGKEKSARADFIIDNNSTLNDLEEATSAILKIIESMLT